MNVIQILFGVVYALDNNYTIILAELYPDATEDIYTKIPEPNIYDLKITAFVWSYHAHNKRTCRKITGLLIMAGKTPVLFMIKQQGAIEMSMYGEDFYYMWNEVEEV